MEDIEIKYKNGFPTKKSLQQLIDKFNIYGLRIGSLYPAVPNLIWDRLSVQERIYEFIDFANQYDIDFESIQDYDSPSVGHLKIKNKIQ